MYIKKKKMKIFVNVFCITINGIVGRRHEIRVSTRYVPIREIMFGSARKRIITGTVCTVGIGKALS